MFLMPLQSQDVISSSELAPLTIDIQINSNLHYTRGISPKRVTSGKAHLSGLALGQHSSEETSQRWRAVGGFLPILPNRESNPRSSASKTCA